MNESTEIIPNLYVGSAPSEGVQLHGVHKLVLCADNYQPPARSFAGVHVLYAPLNDSGRVMLKDEKKIAIYTAQKLARYLGRGDRVLVTCWQGWNRSSLVAGLALMTAHPIIKVHEVIALIRGARGANALSNVQFVDLLNRYENPRTRGLITIEG